MILTLLIVPVIYKMINPIDGWLRKWYEKKIENDI
jgi:HAE1 family hydrophobic/amphiphilic exporter-1